MAQTDFLIVRDESGLPFAFPSHGNRAYDAAFYAGAGLTVSERLPNQEEADARIQVLIEEAVAKSLFKLL